MSWVDLVLNSDAAKLNPERAKELVLEAGGTLPEDSKGAVGDQIGNQESSSPESVVTSPVASPKR